MVDKYLDLIQNEINKNEDCNNMPLWLNSKVYYTDKGYLSNDDKEVLALLSGYNYGKYFYAHIFKTNEGKWISIIAWVNELIEADNINNLFKRYYKVIKQGEYSSCIIQEEWHGYNESTNFYEACKKLIKMINAYKLENRLYNDYTEKYSSCKYEMRIYSVY